MKVIHYLMIAVCLFLLTGCYHPYTSEWDEGTSKEEASIIDQKEPITIVGIYKDGSRGWFITEGLSAEKQAKQLGAESFIFIDAKMDNATYQKALNAAVDEGADGVIICIVDQGMSEETVAFFENYSIPVVATNDPIIDKDGNYLTPFVGVDDYALGNMTGDWMANYAIKNGLSQQGDIGVVILENSKVSQMEQRGLGQRERFLEMIPDFDEDQLISLDYNGTIEDAFEKSMQLFGSRRNVSTWLVMTVNDEGAIGSVRALEQLGIDQNAAVVSIGGTLAVDEFRREYSALKAASYYSPEKIGTQSVQILMDYIEHQEPMPKKQLFNAVIITKDNYQEMTGLE